MNTLDDWPRVKRVLEGALAREGADRQAYLAEVCGTDAALRARIDILLAAGDRVGTFLETPAAVLLEPQRARRPERPRRELLSTDVTAGRGRHGRGLSRPRHEAGSARGAQGPVTGGRR